MIDQQKCEKVEDRKIKINLIFQHEFEYFKYWFSIRTHRVSATLFCSIEAYFSMLTCVHHLGVAGMYLRPHKALPLLKFWIVTSVLYKVPIFWEGHKILRNLPLTFDCMYCRWRFRKILWPSQNISMNFKKIKSFKFKIWALYKN